MRLAARSSTPGLKAMKAAESVAVRSDRSSARPNRKVRGASSPESRGLTNQARPMNSPRPNNSGQPGGKPATETGSLSQKKAPRASLSGAQRSPPAKMRLCSV